MKRPASNPQANPQEIQDRVERRLAELNGLFNEQDRLWINRWGQGTDELRYPNRGRNDVGPEPEESV